MGIVVSTGMGVGAGVEVKVGTAVAAVVITAVVSAGVVAAGAAFVHELDRISTEAVRIARTLAKRCVFIYLRPFRNVIDGIFYY